MQDTTAAWKENQLKNITSETFVEVVLGTGENELIQAMTITDSSLDGDHVHAAYSQLEQIKTNVYYRDMKAYATLEPGLWPLDGSAEFFPEAAADYGQVGYIAQEIGDSSGDYATQPNIRIEFSSTQTKVLYGMTIIWCYPYQEYAAYFRMYFYNGNTLIQGISRNNTDVEMTIDLSEYAISGYNKILIYIDTWSAAYRRPRVSLITLGFLEIFDKTKLTKFSTSQFLDLLSGKLPKRTIEFAVDNTDHRFHPTDDSGIGKYLAKQQRVYARMGFLIDGATEWIDCGEFYLTEWDIRQNALTATFQAQDSISTLLNKTYYKGILAPYGRSLYDLAMDVITEAELSLSISIDASLQSIFTTAPLPIATMAECLQLIANAGCCALDMDREGCIHIRKTENYYCPSIGTPSLSLDISSGMLVYSYDADKTENCFSFSETGHLMAMPETSFIQYTSEDGAIIASDMHKDYEINDFNSWAKTELSVSLQIKEIVVTIAHWTSQNMAELYRATVSTTGVTELWILYNNPASNVTAKITSDSVYLTAAEYYTYACKITLSGSGEALVRLEGTILGTSETESVTAVSGAGQTESIRNPLITSEAMAIAVGNTAKETLQLRKRATSNNFRIDPRLEAGDSVVLLNNDLKMNEIITEMEISYSGAFHGKIEGVIVE